MLEKTIASRVEQHLLTDMNNVFREVPFLQRHVDIVGFEESLERIIAIEAKVKNWRDAVRQARTCMLFTDEVYIAIPDEFIHRVDLKVLGNLGIGLFSVGDDVTIELNTSQSKFKHEFHSNWMIVLLKQMVSYKNTGEDDE